MDAKRCLIVANSFKGEAESLANEITEFLAARNVETEIFSYDGIRIGPKLPNVNFAFCDFAITLGGDGTVLFVCRSCAPMRIPVFPINLGQFGFLASVQKTHWKEDLDVYLKGGSHISERSLVHCEVMRNGKTVFESSAMNDCVISSMHIVNLNVAYNHALLGPFKTSGIIISTPTGSTAYSAAAGGPIVEPGLAALILTPISSFSLSARPLVFGDNGEFAVTVLHSRYEAVLDCDGQTNFPLEEGDVIILNVPEYRARLISSTQEKFFMSLQNKLNWSGAPRA